MLFACTPGWRWCLNVAERVCAGCVTASALESFGRYWTPAAQGARYGARSE